MCRRPAISSTLNGAIVWNDRVDRRFVCHLLDSATGRKRTIHSPVYCLASDGRTALTTDFARINHTRPGNGYAGIPDPNREIGAPADSGIARVDLDSGEVRPLISLASLAAMPPDGLDFSNARHWTNHLLVNPSA